MADDRRKNWTINIHFFVQSFTWPLISKTFTNATMVKQLKSTSDNEIATMEFDRSN